MRKHIYRARRIEDVAVERVLERSVAERLVLGVDVAKEKPFCVVMTGSGEVLETWKWRQPDQTRMLIEKLRVLSSSVRVEMVMESSGTYGDALRERVREIGIAVFRVQTKQVKDAAEVYDGVPSRHDAKCSAVIAWLHLQGRSRSWEPRRAEERRLQALVRVYELHQGQAIESRQRLEPLLARHWPELEKVVSLENASTLAMLAELGGPSSVLQSEARCRELLRQVGGAFLAEQKIDAMVESAHTTTGAAMIEEEEDLVRMLASTAREAQRKCNAQRRKLEKFIEGHPEWTCCADVVGKVTSAALVSKLGALGEYASSASLVKAFGLNLKEASSGRRQGQLAISKRGAGAARYWLYLATLRLIQRDRVVAAWYEAKVERDGGLKMKAVVAVMRKLAKALRYVAQGQEFDSRKLFDVTRLPLSKGRVTALPKGRSEAA